MLKVLIYGMVYLGSALMVYNIYSYVRYARDIRQTGDWEKESRILYLPILLLVMFLLGYLAVGLFGKPDLIISGILFGGSIFVAIMVYLIRRITNRIQLNEQLQAELMAAEASSRAKSGFLSSVSHEMRTPMNAILGTLRLAQGNNSLSAETKGQLDRIEACARHLLALINAVLDTSMIESGELTLKNTRFSFPDAMRQVDSMIESACAVKSLRYHSACVGAVDHWFVGDEAELKEVLLAVLDNAVKFTQAPGTVSCTAEQIASDGDRRTLRFVIRDSGIGMDREFLSTVFEPFAREDLSSTAEHEGTGLGLSIARGIVELMGGTIGIESEKGVGTTVTFTVSLGAAEQEEETPQKPASAAQSAGAGFSLAGKRVLIAEDIDLNAEILTDLLEMEDIVSERAENGEIAVDMFRSSAPGWYDAILMDLRMPVMDGLEATRRIRALDRPDAKRVPILALTANAFEEDVRASLEAGMNAHLSKPADIDLICETLREYLPKD